MFKNRPAIVTIAPEQENSAGIFMKISAAKDMALNDKQKIKDLFRLKKIYSKTENAFCLVDLKIFISPPR